MPAEPDTYDRGEFYRMLSEVQGYLAELHYIDTAMAFMEAEKSRWWEGMPGGNGESLVTVRYGKTFPFTKAYTVPEHPVWALLWKDSREAEVTEHLRALDAGAQSWAETEIESIASRVEPFTWPVGVSYERECIEPVVAAHEMLEDRVGTDFGKLDYSLESWEGDAAENFATNFYSPFAHTLRSQKQVLLALAGGLASARMIAEATQQSLMNVLANTRLALREQLEMAAVTAELERQATIRNCVLIAGGVASVFSGLITEGGLMAMTPGIVGGASSISLAAAPANAMTDYILQGTTAEELLYALSEAITEIDRNDGYEHEELAIKVQDALDRVDRLHNGSDGDLGQLIPMQPDIVHGVNGTDFYLP